MTQTNNNAVTTELNISLTIFQEPIIISSLHDAAMELYEYLKSKGGEADFDELMQDLPEIFGRFKASELHDYLSSLNLARSWFFGFRLTDSEFNKLIDMS